MKKLAMALVASLVVTGAALGQATYKYPKGYPKVVKLSTLPDNIAYWLGSEDGFKTAIAVAPGVWTMNAPGTTPREDADGGSWVGYCASSKKFEKKYHRSEGSTCF